MSNSNKNNIVNNYTNDIEKLYKDFVNNINGLVELCKNNPSKIKKVDNKKELSSTIEIEKDKNEKSLCDALNDIVEWTTWSTKIAEKTIEIPIALAEFIANVLGESVEFVINIANEGIDKLINWINFKLESILSTKNQNKNTSKIQKIIKKVIKKVKILMLQVKKAMLEAQLIVYKKTKKILESMSNGRFNDSMSALFGYIMIGVKACAEALLIAINIINEFVKKLMGVGMAISAGCMSFALSPKAITFNPKNISVEIKPVEPNNDLSSFAIMEPIDKAIEEYVNGINESNNAIEVSYIGSQLAEYKSTGKISTNTLNLSNIDMNTIRSLIDTIMQSLLNISEPLPKFEKLTPFINLRYTLWLSTSFSPAMKQAFGIPGMP